MHQMGIRGVVTPGEVMQGGLTTPEDDTHIFGNNAVCVWAWLMDGRPQAEMSC